MNGELEFSSLSDQVYSYLRRQMNQGTMLPGSTIHIGDIANQLGISKTPLRDALIQLECEGYVEILPRKGVRVNKLRIQDVKNAYDAIGLVEAFIVTSCIDKITPIHIAQLEELNETMISDIKRDDFSTLFSTNLQFHNVYIDPESWAFWKKTGEFREGTILMKELVSVGSKSAVSGNGYFQGDFIGQGHAPIETFPERS